MSTEQKFVMSSTAESALPLDSTQPDIVEASQRERTLKDLRDGLKRWRTWLMLAYHDIKLRYRRSILGPFWITLSMAITAYSMGFLYGHLFHTNLENYCPFLVSSILAWGLISAVITEQTDAFMASASLIKQIKLPYSLYIHRVIARNMIIFFHNCLVMIPIYLIYYKTTFINLNTLILIPSLFLIYINAFIFGLMFAIIGARYRDISQVIKSLVQVTFFVTPVMWNLDTLPQKYHYIIYWNPFFSFLELIRQPLRGQAPDLLNLYIVFFVTCIGATFCYLLFNRYRSRIIYWL